MARSLLLTLSLTLAVLACTSPALAADEGALPPRHSIYYSSLLAARGGRDVPDGPPVSGLADYREPTRQLRKDGSRLATRVGMRRHGGPGGAGEQFGQDGLVTLAYPYRPAYRFVTSTDLT